MPLNDLSVCIGGEAGQGVESSGAGFAQALTRSGLWMLAVPDYHSRIRGGHNFYTIRVSDRPVLAVRDTIEVLLALTGDTVELHAHQLVAGGAIIADEGLKFDEAVLQGRDVRLLRIPLARIAEEQGNPLMVNTAALAALAGLTGLPLDPLYRVIEDNFGRKGPQVVEGNRRAAEAGYNYTREHLPDDFAWQLRVGAPAQRVSITGNQAFAMGAVMGGCKFVAGYPMTPASSVLEYMALHADEWGMVVKHAESETAAANMIVGAAHMGARAMAPTSGGGFDLMTEALSLAGMLETPLVIYLAQRPGPATGLATRQAQGDLFLAHFASHGEFPRVVIAPHTPEEHFQAGFRAFNLAEKYQTLVVVLSDHYNAASYQTTEAAAFDPAQVRIERGKLLSAADLENVTDYKRYLATDDGVSPRALPGVSPNAVFFSTSDMHRQDGHIDERAEVTVTKMEKLMRKQEGTRSEMRPPLRYGPEQADMTFVTWGSSYGPVREAVDLLNAQERSANMVQFVDLWPFPTEAARQALADAKHIVDVEGNIMGQFAFMLHAHTGIRCHERILKYDGRGFTPDYILGHLEGK